jgi:hypothetical protein
MLRLSEELVACARDVGPMLMQDLVNDACMTLILESPWYKDVDIADLAQIIRAEDIDFPIQLNCCQKLKPMKNCEDVPRVNRRRLLGAGVCVMLANACDAKLTKPSFDVVLFNYLDRPIFELLIDGTVDASSDAYPGTGIGIMIGVGMSLCQKKVNWRLDGPAGMKNNGETIASKNSPELVSIPGGRYLGIHVYPDYTVDLIPSVSISQVSQRGKKEMAEAGRDHD